MNDSTSNDRGYDHSAADEESTFAAYPRWLRLPKDYVEHGVPVFIAQPLAGEREFRYPRNWQSLPANLQHLDNWRPGWAVCAVTGVQFDVIDVDPRNGGDASLAALQSAGLLPPVYGEVLTPSGGVHLYVARSGFRKCSPAPGIDVQAGDDQGKGRGFVFIPPTIRSSKDSGEKAVYRTKTGQIDWDGLRDGVDDPAAEAWRGFLADKAAPAPLPAAPVAAPVERPEPVVGLEDVTDCSLGEDERKQRWFHATAVGLVKDMMAAREGHRNDTLNKLAFRLGSVVAGLGMPIEEAAVALAVAALKSGLSETEVAKTIKSGIEGGMKQPMVWSHS